MSNRVRARKLKSKSLQVRKGFVETPKEDGRMTLAKYVVRDDAGRILQIKDLRTALEYIDRFFAVDEDVPSPKKYVTMNGFSAPHYVSGLPSQGLVKTILAAIKVLCDTAAVKDEKGQEAQLFLDLIVPFLKEQPERSREAVLLNLNQKRELVAAE